MIRGKFRIGARHTAYPECPVIRDRRLRVKRTGPAPAELSLFGVCPKALSSNLPEPQVMTVHVPFEFGKLVVVPDGAPLERPRIAKSRLLDPRWPLTYPPRLQRLPTMKPGEFLTTTNEI